MDVAVVCVSCEYIVREYHCGCGCCVWVILHYVLQSGGSIDYYVITLGACAKKTSICYLHSL